MNLYFVVSLRTSLSFALLSFMFVVMNQQRRKSVEKAIPNIADAVKTVVSLSKNEDFKKKCFELIKVGFTN